MEFRIGASKTDEQISEELFAAYKENNIRYMEIDGGSLLKDSGEIKKLAQKYGVTIWSCHLPFCPFDKIDLSSTNEDVRQHTVEYLKTMLDKFEENGIDKAVVHPSAEPITEEERPFRLEAAKKSLNELAEYGKERNVVICVEDLPRTCLGRNSLEIAELIGVHDNLKSCFDTNHLLSENPIDFIKNIGSDIITLHISDYDFVNERHWLPGEGKIDWKALIAALNECGYDGVWMYEVDPKKYLTRIFENANALLANENN